MGPQIEIQLKERFASRQASQRVVQKLQRKFTLHEKGSSLVIENEESVETVRELLGEDADIVFITKDGDRVLS